MKKTQFGLVFLILILVISGIVIYQNQNLHSAIIISVISLILFLLFYKLTITVSDKYVKFAFGIGLINGKYNLKDITQCQPLSYIPFGWGIRHRPGVIIYNVSGHRAIELEIKNKKRKVLIGTNTPKDIADYINSKLGKIDI